MDLLRSFTKDFVGLLYPELCRGCEKPLLTGENRICTDCLLTFPKSIPVDDNEELFRKFEGLLPVEHVYSFLKYHKTGIVRELMHSIKYRGDQELAIMLGRIFGKAIRKDLGDISADVIVPVPLHPKKLRVRGFNQSLLLAEGLSSVLGIGVVDALERVLDNPTQTRKSKVERIENTRGLFAIKSTSDIQMESHVLLIDDTITTGATIRAAGEILDGSLHCKLSVAVLAQAK